MSRFLPILLILAGTGNWGCSGATPACQSSDVEGLVASLQSDRQLAMLLRTIAIRTQTASAVAAVATPSTFENALARAVDEAVKDHGGAWRHNLATSYREGLTADELARVCQAMNAGDAATFRHVTAKIAPAIQARNEPILNQAGADVLEDLAPLLAR